MGIDAVVVRHRSAGVPWQIARWTSAAIVDASEQLARTPRRRCSTPTPCGPSTPRPAPPWRRPTPAGGLRMGVLGDVKHQVARSNARPSRHSAPRSRWWPRAPCQPPSVAGWGAGADVAVTAELDDVLPQARRRPTSCGCSSSVRSRPSCPVCGYTNRFGLTPERAARLPGDALDHAPRPGMEPEVEIHARGGGSANAP